MSGIRVFSWPDARGVWEQTTPSLLVRICRLLPCNGSLAATHVQTWGTAALSSEELLPSGEHRGHYTEQGIGPPNTDQTQKIFSSGLQNSFQSPTVHLAIFKIPHCLNLTAFIRESCFSQGRSMRPCEIIQVHVCLALPPDTNAWKSSLCCQGILWGGRHKEVSGKILGF